MGKGKCFIRRENKSIISYQINRYLSLFFNMNKNNNHYLNILSNFPSKINWSWFKNCEIGDVQIVPKMLCPRSVTQSQSDICIFLKECMFRAHFKYIKVIKTKSDTHSINVLYMHTLYASNGRCKHDTMVDFVYRLCGHNCEYRTTDINFL